MAALTRSARAWARAVGGGVAAGLLTMFVAAAYAMAAVTEPARGWPELGAGGVVAAGCAAGTVTAWVVLWRRRR